MSGRGLEAISSNVDISATERPISVKFIDIGRWGTCVGGTFEHLIKYS